MRDLLTRLRGDSILSTLFQGGSTALIITVAGSGISIAVQLLLARMLLPPDYGLYVFLLACLNVVLLLAKLDMDQVAVRYVGELRVRQRPDEARGFLRRAHQITLVNSVLVAILMAVVAYGITRYWYTGEFVPALIAAAILPFQALIIVQCGALQGFKRILQSGLPNQIVRPIVFIALLALTLLVGQAALDSSIALGLNLAANIVALAVSVVLLRRAVRQELPLARPVYRTREWVRVGVSFLTITLLHVILSQQADVLLVGSLLDMQGAAIYSIASQLSLPLMLVLNAVLQIAAPMIAELHAAGRREDLQRMVRAAVWVSVGIAVPVVLAVALFGRLILAFIGPAYADGYVILVVLTAAYGASAFGGSIAGYLMTMTGHQRAGIRLTAISALVNIVLTVGLLPVLGLLGAALGTAAATLVRLVLLASYLRRRLGVSVVPFIPAPRNPDVASR